MVDELDKLALRYVEAHPNEEIPNIILVSPLPYDKILKSLYGMARNAHELNPPSYSGWNQIQMHLSVGSFSFKVCPQWQEDVIMIGDLEYYRCMVSDEIDKVILDA